MPLRACSVRKEAAVHDSMSMFDWVSIGVALVVWIGLIALVGYAAALAAWHAPRPRHH